MSLLDGLSSRKKKDLEKILIAIRDKCPIALNAILYLETNTGQKATRALNNIRDVVFHLSTTIRDLNTPNSNIQQQLGSIEEHIRRAIIESYEHAVIDQMDKLEKVYAEYDKTVLPIISKLNPAPITSDEVNGKMEKMKELICEARFSKNENNWTPKWEQGCKSFQLVYEEALKLSQRLREDVGGAVSHNNRRKDIKIAFAIAFFFFMLGVIVTYLIF